MVQYCQMNTLPMVRIPRLNRISLYLNRTVFVFDLGLVDIATSIFFIRCVKYVHIRSFYGPYFPAFGLNTPTEYSVSLRISIKCGKIRNRKTLNTNTFHAPIFYFVTSLRLIVRPSIST